MPKSADKCLDIRKEMRSKILHDSMMYFAKNGFSGTKISDLATHIGIGQGTIYVYFNSKEELFREIFLVANNESDIKELKTLSYLPINAKQKIHMLTKSVLTKLENDESYPAKVALNAQKLFETNNYSSIDTTYQSALYIYTAKIIEQGQREKSVVSGSPMKLADYYWGVIYLYAIKKLFTTKYEMLSVHDLERIVLKDN